MKKQIMTRAWEIARAAVKRFGGKASEYIAGSLRIAWKIAKSCGTNALGNGDLRVIRAWVAHEFPHLSGLLESQIAKGGATVKKYMDHAEIVIGNIDIEAKLNSKHETVMNFWYCGKPFADIA